MYPAFGGSKDLLTVTFQKRDNPLEDQILIDFLSCQDFP